MNESITYLVADPTGNITLLAETPVPPSRQPSVAERLMALEPDAEQVGFLSDEGGCDISLRMAGGEFCGNAAMSAAAVFAERSGMAAGHVTVRVSGADEPVGAEVSSRSNGARSVCITMPRPLSVTEELLPGTSGLPVVRFPGICHVMLPEAPDRARAEALAPVWCSALQADALGIMFLDRNADRLMPLVYVPAAGTLVWESSCASGTAAVGAWLARQTGREVSVTLSEPGGILTVRAEPDGALSLSGTVRLVRRKTANILP